MSITEVEPEAVVADRKPNLRTTNTFLRAVDPRWFGFYALVGLIALFSILLPATFPTATNATAILGNEAVGAMLAVGLLIPVVAGYFDISVAGILTLSMIVSAGMFDQFGSSTLLACLAGVGTGVVVGAINGISVAWLRINSLVATLATGSCALGVALWWTNGSIFSANVPAGFRALGDRVLGIPLPVIYTIVVAAIVWWILDHTPVGRYLYSMGDNHEAAYLVGLPTGLLTMGSFVASGSIAGLAGVVEAAILGSGNPQVGASFLLPAFAAVFLGATIFHIGRYNLIGTVTAVVLLAVIVSGLQQFGFPFYIEPLLKGGVLLLAVAFTTGRFAQRK